MATASQLQQLYVAYFGRAADPSGIDYWVAEGTTTKQFAAHMHAQNEFQATYGSKSVASQINQIYQNLFGRDGDAAGLIYWETQINNGTLVLASIANDLIWAVNNGSSATDLTALNNKTTAATSYTASLRTDADALIAYQPTTTDPWVSGDGFAEGVTFITSATATNAPSASDVSTSIATVAALNLVGSSFSYTTASAGDKFTGTAKNDTFTGTHLTFEAGDETKGGAGTGDKLVFRNSEADTTADTLQPVVLEAVETIQVQNIGGAGFTMNLLSATGVTDVVSYNSTANVSFANVQSLAAVTIDNSDIVFNAGYENSLGGTAATFTATLKGGSVVSELAVGEEGGDEFGIMTFTSSGSTANAVTLIEDHASSAVGDLVTININGSAPFTLGTGVTAVAGAGTTINAATATGALTVTGTNFETITLGTGDDTLKVGATQISQTIASAKVNFNGGAGTDIIALGAQDLTATNFLNGAATSTDVVTNFETLTATAANATGATAAVTRSIDANTISGITTVQAEFDNTATATADGTGEDITLAVSDLIAGQTVKASGARGDTHAENQNYITLDMDSPTGSSDQVTFESIASSATTAHVNLFGTLTVNTTTVSSVAEKVEILEVKASNPNVTTTVGTTIEAIAAGSTATINITGASSLTVNAVEIYDSSTADTTVGTIDASAFTGDLTLGTSTGDFKTTNADDVTVTLGTGTNAIYAGTALGTGDTIDGSLGTADTLYMTGSSAGVPAAVTNVETLSITSGSTTSNSLEKFTGYTTIDVTNGANSQTISNILDTGVTIKVDDIHATKTITLNKTTAGGTLDVEYDGIILSTGSLSTNATTLDLAHTGTDANGDYISDDLAIAGSVTTINLSGGGETSSTGTYSTFTLDGTTSLVAVTSTYNGSLDLDSQSWDTNNGATITTGATTAAATLTVDAADLANGLLKVVDTAGTDTLTATYTGGALGLVDLTGIETIDFADFDMGSDFSMNLRDVTGLSTLRFTGPSTGDLAEAVTITSMPSGVTTAIAGQYGNGDTDAATFSVTAKTGSTTDTHVLTTDGADFTSDDALDAFTFNGFETFTISAGLDDNINLNRSSEDALLTLGSTTTLNVGGDIVAATDSGAVTLGTVAATSLTSVALTAEGGNVTIADLGTTNSLETFTITAAASKTVTVSDFDSTSLDTITISGAGSATLTAADATSLDAVNAAGLSGTLTISSGFATAAGALITGGTAVAAVDAITMTTSNIKALTLGANGTAETGDDSLTLTGAMNSGTGTIDLSSSTDQITKLGGVNDSVVQTGINDLNLTGLTSTGSYGFHITAAATGSEITGSAYGDTIVLGDKSDIVSTSAYSAGVTDTITGFVNTGTGVIDKLNVTSLNAALTVITGTLSTGTVATTNAANHVYLVTSVVAGQADSVTNAATALEAAAVWTLNDVATYFIVVDNNTTGVFRYTENAANDTVQAADLSVVATIDTTITTANLLYV